MDTNNEDYFEVYSFVQGAKNEMPTSIKIDGKAVTPEDIYQQRGYDMFGKSIDEVEEKGSHYKFEYILSEEDITRGYLRVDPYFIFKLYDVGGGPMEHIAKKALRGNKKGHSKVDVYKEIIACAKRGIELEEGEGESI